MWDLGSQTRDRTHIPCIRKRSPNPWTTREVPDIQSWQKPIQQKHCLTGPSGQWECKVEGGCKMSQILLAGKSWQNDLAAFQWKDDPKSRASSQQMWNRSQVLKSRQGTCNMGPADSRITVDQQLRCASSVTPLWAVVLPLHVVRVWVGNRCFYFYRSVRGTPQTSSPTPAPQRIWARGLLLAWWLGSAWAQAWLMALGSSPSFPP